MSESQTIEEQTVTEPVDPQEAQAGDSVSPDSGEAQVEDPSEDQSLADRVGWLDEDEDQEPMPLLNEQGAAGVQGASERSWSSTAMPRVVFGMMGAVAAVGVLAVLWPSGQTETVANQAEQSQQNPHQSEMTEMKEENTNLKQGLEDMSAREAFQSDTVVITETQPEQPTDDPSSNNGTAAQQTTTARTTPIPPPRGPATASSFNRPPAPRPIPPAQPVAVARPAPSSSSFTPPPPPSFSSSSSSASAPPMSPEEQWAQLDGVGVYSASGGFSGSASASNSFSGAAATPVASVSTSADATNSEFDQFFNGSSQQPTEVSQLTIIGLLSVRADPAG